MARGAYCKSSCLHFLVAVKHPAACFPNTIKRNSTMASITKSIPEWHRITNRLISNHLMVWTQPQGQRSQKLIWGPQRGGEGVAMQNCSSWCQWWTANPVHGCACHASRRSTTCLGLGLALAGIQIRHLVGSFCSAALGSAADFETCWCLN